MDWFPGGVTRSFGPSELTLGQKSKKNRAIDSLFTELMSFAEDVCSGSKLPSFLCGGQGV